VQIYDIYIYFCLMRKKPIVTIWLDKRRLKKPDLYPVKIKITHQRQRYYYPANMDLSEQDFMKAISNSPRQKLKDAHVKLFELERQANAAVDKINDELKTEFTIALFEKLLQIQTTDYHDVFRCFERKIETLNAHDQVKTAECYTSALRAFKEFTQRNSLSFVEIDKHFLNNFESSLLKQKKSLSTIGIYARNLRTIFNEAIDEKLVSYELYPFGRNKYQVPQAVNNKRALKEADLIKLLNYQPEEDSWEDFARDYWLFSMFCQGINMKDIASLRYKHIQDDKIIFIRLKTQRTKKANLTPTVIYLSEEAKAIIHKRGNRPRLPEQYIFPIYSDEVNAKKNLGLVSQQLKMLNKYIRIIAQKAGIEQDFTFYAARHSFATTLKRQGRTTEEIQEFVGHSSKRTTELYLASFGDDYMRGIMSGFVSSLKSKSKV
jgi:integrase/recombinase XerD